MTSTKDKLKEGLRRGDFFQTEEEPPKIDLSRPEGRLKAARIAAGYPTATAFADAHGVKSATYLTHERGRDDPAGRGMSAKVAGQYADYLREDGLDDITADWIRHASGRGPQKVVELWSFKVFDAKPLATQNLRYQVAAAAAGGEAPLQLDRPLMAAVILAVDAALDDAELTLPPNKRVELYFAIHDLEALRDDDGGDKVVDMERYRQLLLLAS